METPAALFPDLEYLNNMHNSRTLSKVTEVIYLKLSPYEYVLYMEVKLGRSKLGCCN